ncbi:MAG: leucyl aminopeptidase family protein, partial [Candidatus Aenigmarchaeota archaeon]|nr:leucyl aminopeptidase family protein [Candidatus Aenigmarchaeota archaeon]
VTLKILKEKELVKNKMNLHLAVNKGSKKEPMLIIAKYNGGKGKYTAFIGKGLTFDSGGLNLKPSGYLETMREDMGGSAAVLGALRNTLELRPKKNILFVLGVAENAIGPNATKPGDVIKSYEGKTVEIANTDAEGRLVLADANAYITKNYDVKTVVNIATLTGAVVAALGFDHSAVMSTKQKIADELIAIGKEVDEPVWQLPMYDELKEHVKSKYADIKNVGLPKGAAGTVSAGEFLRQFARDKDWAHLDIAGTAFVEGDGRSYYGFGATGSGVRLLSNYALKYA